MVATSVEQAWRDTLHNLQQRNAAVEVSCVTAQENDDQLTPIYRLRLLAFNNEAGVMTLQMPSGTEAFRNLVKEQIVKVLAIDSAQRWELTSVIAETVNFNLNEQQSVPAIILSPPMEVNSAQRRDCFRVSLNTTETHPDRAVGPVMFSRYSPDALEQPKDASELFEGRIRNLGGGGMGVVVEASRSRKINVQDLYLSQIKLPTHDVSLRIPVRVVHVEPLDDSRHVYLGLRFEYENQTSCGRCEAVIGRFCAEIQRYQIQRGR